MTLMILQTIVSKLFAFQYNSPDPFTDILDTVPMNNIYIYTVQS